MKYLLLFVVFAVCTGQVQSQNRYIKKDSVQLEKSLRKIANKEPKNKEAFFAECLVLTDVIKCFQNLC